MPYPPPPQRPTYGGDNSGRTMLDLIMRQGEIQAEGARASGGIWGNALGNIGQTLAGGLQQRAARREEEQERNREATRMGVRDRAFTSAVESWDGKDPKDLLGRLTMFDPKTRIEMANSVIAFRSIGDKGDDRDWTNLQQVARGLVGQSDEVLERWGPGLQAKAGPMLAQRMGGDPAVYTAAATPQQIREMAQLIAGQGAQEEAYTLAPGQQRRQGSRLIAENPAAPPRENPPAVGSFEDYVVQRFGPRPSPDQIAQAKETYGRADDRPITINQPRPLSQTAEAGIIQRLTKSWDATAAPVREINRQVGIMDAGLAAARRGDVNAGSQAVIQTFNKILDSLSVVREGEYARTAEGQSAINRINGALERLTTGGAGVPLGELEKFATLAKDMAERQKAFLPAMRERIGRQASRYNIPEELIFEDAGGTPAAPPGGGGVAPVATPAGGAAPVRVNSPADAARLPPGTQFQTPDGRVMRVPLAR